MEDDIPVIKHFIMLWVLALMSVVFALGNSTGNPMGIAPATRTRPVQYPYPQPHRFTRQNEPKNVEIGQEMSVMADFDEFYEISYNSLRFCPKITFLGSFESSRVGLS